MSVRGCCGFRPHVFSYILFFLLCVRDSNVDQSWAVMFCHVRVLCSGVLVGLPHCCGFWRLFRPTFAENDNLIIMDIVNN